MEKKRRRKRGRRENNKITISKRGEERTIL